jgi:apolipoprotein D and lipocalin family protein
MGNSSSSTLPVLQSVSHCDTAKFMGTWFVIGVKPTVFEKTCSNAVERYTLNEGTGGPDINIDFRYNKDEPINSPLKSMPQKGWVQAADKSNSGDWKVSPLWPIKMPYKIIEVDDKDYMYSVIGYPSRDYCWILYRKPQMPQDLYNTLTKRLVEKHQYSLEGLRQVPQKWTREEREMRGLSEDEVPDNMLTEHTPLN